MSKIIDSLNGKEAEYKVVTKLLEHKYNVFFPALEATGTDLICVKGNCRPIRIQVKSSKYIPPGSTGYDVSLKLNVKGKSAESDVFILVTPDGMYLYKTSTLRRRWRITVHPTLSSFENWSLLDKIKL